MLVDKESSCTSRHPNQDRKSNVLRTREYLQFRHPFAIAVPLGLLVQHFNWNIESRPVDTLIFRFHSPIFHYIPPGIRHVFTNEPPARFALPPPLGIPSALPRRTVPRRPDLGLPLLPDGFLQTLLSVLDPQDASDLLNHLHKLNSRKKSPKSTPLRFR